MIDISVRYLNSLLIQSTFETSMTKVFLTACYFLITSKYFISVFTSDITKLCIEFLSKLIYIAIYFVTDNTVIRKTKDSLKNK